MIPRLQSLAADLDAAHAIGFVHGRLHPGRIIVTDDGTYLIGRRVPATATLTPSADQAAFAVIAYEWMFGRRVSPGASVAPSPPSGVDRGRLSQALTRALSHERDRQFDSISDFVAALEKSQIPELPLMAAELDEDDPVQPFVPESAPRVEPIKPIAPAPIPDVPLNPVPPVAAVATERKSESARFGGFALIFAAIVGGIFGFAAGYMAKPRALQTYDESSTGSTRSTGSTGSISSAGSEAVEPAERKEPVEPVERVEPAEPRRIGRLLVRSTPTGAAVSIDGVARGVTPLAVRELDLGSREITVTRRGYQSEERRIVLTKARPSRTVDVRLSQQQTPAPRPSTPASLGKPPATSGALAVESRPPGAAVLVNGKPSGTTPVTLNDLAPGEYRVTMTLKGFRDFETTVRVVAGERARAAARLTELEQE